MKNALRGVSLAFGAARFERVVLAIFAVVTLLMPLLYFPANYFIVATAILILCVVAIKQHRQTNIYVHLRTIIAKYPVLTVLAAALVTRLLWVLVVSSHTNQVSDFLDVYNDSLQDVPSSRHVPIWTHFITYPYILHFFANIFGNSMLVGGVFNAVVCSVSILLVYLTGAAVINRKAGLIAAGLMMLWPGMAAYTSIYTPDHLSVCFMLLSIFCFVKFVATKKTRTKLLYVGACAVSLWALGFFKDVAPVLVIAFAVAVTTTTLRSGRLQGNLTNAYCVLGLGVLVVLSGVTHVPIISAIADRPANPSLVSYFVYTGLGGNNDGSWQPQIMDRYTQLVTQNNYDYKLANDTMMHEALDSIRHRLPELPETVWNKSRSVQATDDGKIFWVEVSVAASGNTGLYGALRTVVEPMNNVFFAGLVMLMGASVYYLWKDSERAKLMLLVVVCAGYSTLLLIIEVQSRYRYLIEPLYCMLAAYGLLRVYGAYVQSKPQKSSRRSSGLV